MSYQQPSDKLKETFDRFDIDGNGQIDLGEFRKLLDDLGSELERSGVEVAFDAIDVDENGLIDFEEFALWWESSCL
jgi:Ca2+-binding EF-hand superfamily protein